MINYFKSRIIILFPCNFNSFLVCATTCTSLLQRIPKHIIALRYPFAIRNNSLRRPQLPHLSRCPGDKSCNYNKSSLKKQNDDKMRKIIQKSASTILLRRASRSITNNQNGYLFLLSFETAA